MSSTIKTPRYIMNLDKTAYIPAPLRKLLNPKNNALPDTHELCLVGQEETMNNDLDDKNYTGLRFIHIEKNKKAYNLLSTKLQKAVDVINDMIKRENSSFNKNDCCGIHTLGMVPKSEITALNELGYGLLSWHGLFVYEQTSTTTTCTTTSTTTSTTTYNTPYNFNTIKGQSFTPTLTTLTSFENLDRVLISIDDGATYLSINDSYTLEFVDSSDLITTEGKSTYGALLKATFQLVTETNSSGSYYRLDSEMHPMYSLDIIEDTLVFNNAWDYNRSVSTVNSEYTGGYVLFEITSTSLTPYKRYKYNVDLDTTTDDTAFSEDTTFSSELYYDGSNWTLSSSNSSSFTFYESDLDLDIPSDFNPLGVSRVSNYSVLWESIDNLTGVSENALYGGTSSTIYKNIQSTYQPQITTVGYDTGTDSTTCYAEEMLDEIFDTGTSIRYEKSLYTSFRDAMLQTTLQSYGIVNGELGLNTVPYVFFTNEQDDDGDYHPFMVIGSWSISDKPNRLIDVTTPPGEGGGVDYDKGNVTRSTTLGTYLMKIPMRDYGEITNVTDNDLTTVGTNLRDDASSTDDYSVYNYASISAVGVAIDGVPIYPLLNNTLTVAQEKAEITNTGIHVGQGLQLHWHADGHSATGNGLNLYNLPDYVDASGNDNDHPPLIGFGLDGIALYGKYEASYSSMDGYDNDLDDYGGHSHGDYGYHYHAHTVNSVEEGLSDTSYTCHILMKGAWIGAIDDIPDFWDSDSQAPRLSGSSSDSIYAGGYSTT